ncbi:AAA family ATPase [Cytobacillus dafuensis]|uniref:AAA family ATPase n=1 Tax=Cytobacillus dafuensis TaxID=1742359 RepID=UPI00070CA433|nr:AAA family ATPase [Cytobacillus dafuensis]
MINLSGYKRLKQKDADQFAKYYMGFSSIDHHYVIIQKVIEPSLLSSYDFEHLQKEAELISEMNHPSIVPPMRLEKKNNEIFPVYEPFRGVPFKKYVYTQTYSLKEFFVLAIQLCEIVENTHDKDFMFLHLNPYNFMVNTEKQQVFLLGIFNSIIKGKTLKSNRMNKILPAWEIAYISPELTGRMNVHADSRANLYTLGIIFYEMLTKQLPFAAAGLSETIHSHLTRLPKSPSEFQLEIPEIISTIILKLLEKSPDERYQSANSLKKDLEHCYHEYLKTGWVKNFPLRILNKQTSERKNTLYGREQELNILTEGLQHVLSGHQKTAFIFGTSGSGKTSLVYEMRNSVIENRVIFLEGKFDQLHRYIPYTPIIQAFKTWIRIILSKGEAELSIWKTKILHELGPNASSLSFLLPEIEWIIGNQPIIEGLSSFDNHSLYLIMFHKLIKLISDDCPLIFFIDDLQWADAASLELICYLVTNNHSNRVYIMIAYRDGTDLHENKPVNDALRNILAVHDDNIVIPLQPLTEEQIMQWICVHYDIEKDSSKSKQLSSIIYKITAGNPFFITQIFRSLSREKIVQADGTAHKIHYTVLKELSINEDIVSYVISRIKKLPQKEQEILKAASCFGQKVDGNKLAAVLNMDNQLTDHLLLAAVNKGFLVLVNENNQNEKADFLFIHDRVQQALYSLLTLDEKQIIHLNIGRHLKSNGNTHLDKEDLFEVVSHLNFSDRLLLVEERKELASLNAVSGNEAIKAAAFQAAYVYFSHARKLLHENSWKENYALTFQIMKGLGESAYLNSKFDEAEHAFNEVLEKAHTKEEKIKLYNMMIKLFTHLHRVNEAVDAGLKGMQLFSWKIKHNPGKTDIAKELLLIKLSLIDKNPASLLDLPEMKEESKKLFLQTLINLNAPSFHVNQNLSTYLMLKAFQFTLKYGKTDTSSLVFNNFSLIQSAGFGNFTASYEYGNLAIKHVEQSNRIDLKARVFFVFGTFVNHWKNPLYKNLDYLRESQHYSVESGNIHLAGATSSFIIMTLLLKGERLEDVLAGVNTQLEFVKSINYRISVDFINEMKHWLEVLMNQDIKPDFDMPITNNDQSGDVIHYTLRLQMAFLLNEEAHAKKILEKLTRLINKTNVLVITPDYYFYHTLWLCRFYKNSNSAEKKVYIRTMKKHIKKMKKWSKNSPANYQHKYLLMKAEFLKVLEKSKEDIAGHYEKAAHYASENGFIQDEAITYECIGHFYMNIGYRQLGHYYLKMAYEQFLNWGTIRKAEDLSSQYPGLSPHIREESSKGLNLDAQTIIKAALAISKEINYEELMVVMMKIMIENAGAEKGYLFLNEEAKLNLAIQGDLQKISILDYPLVINDLHHEIPLQLIHYVHKTEEPIVLENASKIGLFTEDPYIKSKKPKSVLSLPIKYQNLLIGILYLENNMISHAFTEDRIQILMILSSQAAISIFNARVYMMLEDKVKARTVDLEAAISNLAEANKKLEQEETLRRDFLANISHDLRTPITSIQGYIEALIDGIVETPDKQLIYLKRSRDRIISLNHLIQDLFDLSQLTSGNIHFLMENVAVNKLFHHLSGQYEWDVKKSGLDYIITIPNLTDQYYPLVYVDIRRIDQVISNLINNSIKYTKAGKIQLELIIDDTSDYVTFAVHDSGTGIEPNDIETIFNRSYTKKGQAKETGHGLGLAICKEIIRKHCGEIWAESEVSKGTSIYFTLPKIKIDEDELLSTPLIFDKQKKLNSFQT